MKKTLKHLIKGFLGFCYLKFNRLNEQAKGEVDLKQVAKLAKFIGYGVRFNGPVRISNPENLTIGNNVHIGGGAFIRAGGVVEIGDNTHISRNLTLYSENHDYKGVALPYDEKINNKSVIIKKNVWIGHNVSILPGVTIGEGAIIGLGTVVTKNVPDFAILGHPHPNIIKERDKEHYHQLEEKRKYGGIGGQPLPQSEIDKFI